MSFLSPSEQKSFFGFRSPRSCDISTPFPPTECTRWVCVSPRIKRGKIHRLNGLSIYFSNLNVRECAVYLFWGKLESFVQFNSARTSEIHHQLRTTLLMAARNESATLAPFQMEGKARGGRVSSLKSMSAIIWPAKEGEKTKRAPPPWVRDSPRTCALESVFCLAPR